MRPISTLKDIAAGLDALCRLDPRLEVVRAGAGDVPLRRIDPGFASLVSIVVAQQVSRASAGAILARLSRLADPLSPEMLLSADDSLFGEAGLSRPKQRSLLALSEAVMNGLDLGRVCDLQAEEAIALLTSVSGIGRWTAEVYLLTAAGHPDVFPARDVALQSAVGHALGIAPRPGEKQLIEIAESWSPHRGVASRLFWAYYRQIRGREGAPPS
ncbi:DNA-3-methyladenine glycosylase [Mesorhizobium sp. VNQ89]|uniref:DNA-3-methyladenine glycosylase family protein n=1 Tax=Mesorhizobium quangtriensis TaxID=3157709 RepID=UPI0032B73043